MESKPLVSIIITAYNKGPYILETVNSALAQTYNPIEIVVVNDGSTDELTAVNLDSIKDERVRVIHTPNRGVVSARNTAVKESSGKYILPVDGDDLVAPEYISEAVAILEKQPEVGIVYCAAEKFGAESGAWHLPEYSLQTILETNPIHVSAVCRRNDYDKIGGWKANTEYFFEDWDFFISLVELGVGVYKIPKVLFYYRILPNSRTRLLEKEKTQKALRQVYLNHTALYAQHFYDPLNLYHEVRVLRKVEKEYHLLQNSIPYRLGRLLLSPFYLLRKVFK